MKTLVILISALVLLVFLSYKNFKRTTPVSINEMHLRYVEQTLSDVAAIDSMDKYFSTFAGYSKLKEKQYRICLIKGFNEAPADLIYAELFKLLGAESLNEHDKTLCMTIFRCSILFRRMDEGFPPAVGVTKEDVLSNFMSFVI